MKHALVKPAAKFLLVKRFIGEKKSDGGIFLEKEQGVTDFVVHGEVIAVGEVCDAVVGSEVIFHELAVEGGFRDTEFVDYNFLLVPAEKILGTYGS